MSYLLVRGELAPWDLEPIQGVKTEDYDSLDDVFTTAIDLIERHWADWAHVVDLATGRVVWSRTTRSDS
jgi:hypothetical protein